MDGTDRTSSMPGSVLSLKVDKGQGLRSGMLVSINCVQTVQWKCRQELKKIYSVVLNCLIKLMSLFYLWDQLTVTTVWNTRETGDIYSMYLYTFWYYIIYLPGRSSNHFELSSRPSWQPIHSTSTWRNQCLSSVTKIKSGFKSLLWKKTFMT